MLTDVAWNAPKEIERDDLKASEAELWRSTVAERCKPTTEV
jgi:hypothetical protein